MSTEQRVTVEDIMAPKPYTVAPDAFINQVAKQMASKKQGSAVVVDRGPDALEGKLPRAQAIVDAQRRPERPKTKRIGREALA